MKYVEFGSTGQQISAIAFGCMSLTREREADGKAAVHRAFELGITVFDTADIYGRGISEEILGEVLREGNISREQVIIASKCSIVSPGMNDAYTYKAYDLSPAYLKASCEASLKRLGTDYIDLYQLHWPNSNIPIGETMSAMEKLVEQGKVRHIGVSNF